MTDQIMNSFLLYVDTERSKNSNSTGTNIIVPLNESNVVCGDNEFIRLSLVNFSSFRNYPSINLNNNVFQMRCTRAIPPAVATTPNDVAILAQNYKNLNDIAVNYATNMAAEILVWLTAAPATAGVVNVVALNGPAPVSIIQPAATTGASGTGNNIFDCTFEARDAGNAPIAHGITAFIAQFLVSKGDCWAIMGGNRERDPADTTTDGMVCTIPTANTIRIVGRYPMQQYTNDYVYVRTNIQSSNMQTPSFNAGDTDVGPGRVGGSRILARIPSYDVFNYFVTNTQREYFINLTQRSIPELTLYLTDSAGRDLPFAPGQNILGNMSFSCVIRVEIVRSALAAGQTLQTAPINHPVPPRFSSRPLIIPDAGEDTYKENM